MEPSVNYDSPRELSAFLEERGLRLQKKFGQNFLINRGAREKILEILGAEAGDRVWEIGPGIGAMTAMLLERGALLTAFELDRGFSRVLRELFGEDSRFSLVEGDALRTWKPVRDTAGAPDFVMGNLPYNAASAIILDMIRERIGCRKMVFTVQKEAAQRMAAGAGDPSYSSFSIICRFEHEVRLCGDLRPGSFFPAPEVVSSIVEIVPAPEKPRPLDRELFFALVESLFAARRKTVRNNLHSNLRYRGIGPELAMRALEEEGISPSLRGENLTPEQVVSLSNRLTGLIAEREGR